jgi:hypothetical protein
LTAVAAQAATTLRVTSARGGFPLVADGCAATVCVSPKEPAVVAKAASLLADDVQRVSGRRPAVTGKSREKSVVVVATIGCNSEVDRLIAKGRLDVSAIRGGWEQFIIRELDHRLYIVGSDRRGTAYGVFTLSEQIGVSPWYWWADVPVQHRDALYVTADYTSTTPTVKYRGIFINDEDWGLQPWAAKNYERQLGDIGPRTYARVCELLLRLKANMLAPAMHDCTGAFYSHPESAAVADSFAIVITTSHCEPLLLNNAAKSEWDQERDGDWNYKTNSETIRRKWDDRLSTAARYENIYTVAMRGLHDAGLRGDLPMSERVPLIERVISDQRQLLSKHKAYAAHTSHTAHSSHSHHPKKLSTPLPTREGPGEGLLPPQIFVPYKETMDIYEHGLRVPDDITLVWVDDNYGYMKRVSSPVEQQRSGRAGVYYHLSYLGTPHDYLWLNTTPPVLMYEELKKAYDHGADRYWLLNVGDIKPMELGIQTFMEMAWNLPAFDIERANRHQAAWLARAMSCNYDAAFQSILDDYYRLAWSRKPEYMGWEYQWDDEAHTGLKSTDFSFRYQDEAQRRLADYQRISDEVEALAARQAGGAAFFELLQFPVQAAYQMNRKFLMAQLNRELVAEGRLAEANWAARQMEQAYDSIEALNHRYNELLDGKWRGMMALATSYTPTCQFYQKPQVTYTPGAGERPVLLTPLRGNQYRDCQPIDLWHPVMMTTPETRLVRGIGYDWTVVQLGSANAASGNGDAMAKAVYTFSCSGRDSIDVVMYAVPFWPLYAGKSNRIGVSVDASPMQVFENKFKEWGRSWKDQVMRNGVGCRLRFAVDASLATHTLTLYGIDPGQMVQRIVVDWGGLLPTYIP